MEKGLKGAAFVIGSMICAQHSPMDHFMYYDARPCAMNGMFDTDTLAPLKGYYAFPMYNTLYKIGTEAQSSADEGMYSLAVVGKEEAAILVTYYTPEDDSPAQQLKLCMDNLPQGEWRAQYYLLDEAHDSELVREEVAVSGNLTAYLPTQLFGTYLIKLRRF